MLKSEYVIEIGCVSIAISEKGKRKVKSQLRSYSPVFFILSEIGKMIKRRKQIGLTRILSTFSFLPGRPQKESQVLK
jgi:hypothetical protein